MAKVTRTTSRFDPPEAGALVNTLSIPADNLAKVQDYFYAKAAARNAGKAVKQVIPQDYEKLGDVVAFGAAETKDVSVKLTDVWTDTKLGYALDTFVAQKMALSANQANSATINYAVIYQNGKKVAYISGAGADAAGTRPLREAIVFEKGDVIEVVLNITKDANAENVTPSFTLMEGFAFAVPS